MKAFMNLVLKINLCVINPNNKNQEVQKIFDSFIPKPNATQEAYQDPRSEEFELRIKNFVENYILAQDTQ